jgi:hypothetical protein
MMPLYITFMNNTDYKILVFSGTYYTISIALIRLKIECETFIYFTQTDEDIFDDR